MGNHTCEKNFGHFGQLSRWLCYEGIERRSLRLPTKMGERILYISRWVLTVDTFGCKCTSYGPLFRQAKWGFPGLRSETSRRPQSLHVQLVSTKRESLRVFDMKGRPVITKTDIEMTFD